MTPLEVLIGSITLGFFGLVVPDILVTLLLNNQLFRINYLFLTFFYMGSIYYIIKFMLKFSNYVEKIQDSFILSREKFIERVSNLLESAPNIKNTQFTNYLYIILTGLILNYVFIAFFAPMRGWDALHFYIPNGYYFYLINGFPSSYNPLNFFLPFKSPLNSLYISFSYYVNGEFSAQLIPLLFFVGLILTTYLLSKELGMSKNTGLINVIILLSLPITFEFIFDFAYYQDLPLGFFYSSLFYFFIKYQKNPSQHYYLLFASVSTVLLPLSKLSGFIAPLILFLSFRNTSKTITLTQRIVLFLLSAFLAYKASTNYFIGIGVFVSILGVSLLYLNFKSVETSFTKKSWLYIVLTLIAGIVTTGIWITQIVKFPSIRDGLYSLFFDVSSNSTIQFSLGLLVSPPLAYFENAHAASYLTIFGVLFFANAFNTFLVLPKLIGLGWLIKEGSKQPSVFTIISWMTLFFMFWLAYFPVVSVRYLMPILVPVVLMTGKGIELTVKQIYKNKNTQEDKWSTSQQIITIILVLSNFIGYYPFIPFDQLFADYNYRIFFFHKFIFITLLYVLCFYIILLFPLLYPIDQKSHLKKYVIPYDPPRLKRILTLTLIFLFFLPFLLQLGFLITNGLNVNTYQANFYYSARPGREELNSFLSNLQISQKSGMVGVNIPGIEVITTRAFLDLILIDQIPTISKPLKSTNITNVINELKRLSIDIFIGLEPKNSFFQAYNSSFVNKYPFIRFVQTHNSPIFVNSEFSVYLL